MPASSRIVLITGANTGLGFETAKALYASARQYTILLGGRDINKATAAVKQITEVKAGAPGTSIMPTQIDIEDDQSIKRLLEEIKKSHGKLDILVNNAGAQFDGFVNQGKMTEREMWDKSWSVNVTSTQVLTSALVPLLIASDDPRVIFLTSGTASIGEATDLDKRFNQSPEKGWPKDPNGFPSSLAAYRSSKVGLNMMMREWLRVLRKDGVKAWSVSPGMLATGLGVLGAEKLKERGAVHPSEGGAVLRQVVEGERDHQVGMIVRKDDIQPW